MQTTLRVASCATTAAASGAIWANANGLLTLESRQIAALVIITIASVAVHFGARALTTAARTL